MYYNPRIIKGELPINIDLEMGNKEILLKSEDVLPVPISQKGDVVFYRGNIYLLSIESGTYYKKLYTVLSRYKEITFKKDEVSEVLSNVIAKLKNICSEVIVDKKIEENTCETLKIKYYFDLEEEKVTCDLRFEYEGQDEGKLIM